MTRGVGDKGCPDMSWYQELVSRQWCKSYDIDMPQNEARLVSNPLGLLHWSWLVGSSHVVSPAVLSGLSRIIKSTVRTDV